MHSAEQELYEEFVELVEAEGLELDLHGRGGKGDVEVLKDLGMEQPTHSNTSQPHSSSLNAIEY